MEDKFLIDLQETGQILPASRSGEPFAVHRRLDPAEIARFDVQIRTDGRMDLYLFRVLLPHLVIRLHMDHLDTVQGHHIEFPVFLL